MTDEVDLF